MAGIDRSLGSEHHAISGTDTYRRRAANDHRTNRICNGICRVTYYPLFPQWQGPLIKQMQGLIIPANGGNSIRGCDGRSG
ncbi:hypothetical protein GCM10022278_06490 [Allohahella marinimesophila]|uniref:Uncharacterized protein n=1 Tax=Allohahella marinimesophila TaxID=1054972 RepID=A0ABP7NM14_9GAMM